LLTLHILVDKNNYLLYILLTPLRVN